MPVSVVCAHCGQTFKVKPSHLNRRKLFCSNACYTASGERAENGRNNGMKGKTPYKVHPLLGKQHSPEAIQKMREVKLGEKNPRYGVALSESTRKALSEARLQQVPPMLGKHHSKETIAKMKTVWQDPEHFRMMMKEKYHARPNQGELLLDSWLQESFPSEWKYVGAGDFILGGRNPDWLNINGHKTLIELFGEYWHPETDEPETIEHYSQFGFKTLVIWYRELKDKELVLEKIRNFATTAGCREVTPLALCSRESANIIRRVSYV